MKDYVVDLEIAKELKENGFQQESEFYWQDVRWKNKYGKFGGLELRNSNKGVNTAHVYSAPTSDKILKELPVSISIDNKTYCLEIHKIYIDEDCIHQGYIVRYEDKIFDNGKLSNALAKMWLYLKKGGYIK